MQRVVKTETSESLTADNSATTRRDKNLRKINWLMRSEPWIVKTLSEFENLTKVVVIGTGEERLTNEIKAHFPHVKVIHIVPTEDIFKSGNFDNETVVVANLFIHRLDDDQLWSLGEKISQCRGIIMSEPHRYWFSKLLSYALFPLVNQTTRHNMLENIESGFRFGEIPGMMDVDWHWDERPCIGGIRSVGRKV